MEPLRIHLLDVGKEKYGDCILCEFGNTTVLIDGAHPKDGAGTPGHISIPDQLATILGHQPPFGVSLLTVTHAHKDHIGCLPGLVTDGRLSADFALVADPKLGWGRPERHVARPLDAANRVSLLVAALSEEPHADLQTDAEFSDFLTEEIDLEPRYNGMVDSLVAAGTHVVRFGRDDPARLLSAFNDIGMQIVGPSDEHLIRCGELIAQQTQELTRLAEDLLDREPSLSMLAAYQKLLRSTDDEVEALLNVAAVRNLMSLLVVFEVEGRNFLFTGDMQFNHPGVGELKLHVAELNDIIDAAAPYDLVKIAHHGSDDAFDEEIFEGLGTETVNFGICTGESSTDHPHKNVLTLLEKHSDRITWVRTDRNRLSTFSFTEGRAPVSTEEGHTNDPTPNA
jgi:beta-lactamase superfamily II metal-dependent hydrolase